MIALSGVASAQSVAGGNPSCPQGIGPGTCGIGQIQANCACTLTGYPRPDLQLRYAYFDRFSPRPVYAYNRRGIEAQRTYQWNQRQMQSYPWHCQNSYWQYGRPTALVVPPTASFQTQYSWGVGNTRSVPIYHQFGRSYPGPGVAPPHENPLPRKPLRGVAGRISRLPGNC